MSTSINRNALLYCSLLALQFGLQPIITKKFAGVNVSKTSIVIATEVFKILISSFSILSGPKVEIEKIRASWTLQNSIKVAALPATLYAIQNLLIQNGFVYLDSMTFNILNQTKTISAAFWLYLLMGQKQSIVQIFALLMLFVAAMVLNMNSTSSSPSEPHHDDTHKSFGILLVASASMLSGLSAALTQRAMTNSRGEQRHVMLLSAEMAVYGIVFLSINLLFNSDVQLGGGLLSNWSAYTFIPVLTNAFGGLIVGLVTKYAGGVVKGFALIAGIITTGVAQWVFDNKPLGTKDLVGIALVSLSIFLHTRYPPAKKEKVNTERNESVVGAETTADKKEK